MTKCGVQSALCGRGCQVKFLASLASRFDVERADGIMELFANRERLEAMAVDEFMAKLVG